MLTIKRLFFSTPILVALLLVGGVAAQHEGHGKTQDKVKAAARVGDAYPFDTCPISGKKLGAMGDPLVKTYKGREVRYCCGGCTGKFEKDLPASLAKLDAKIIKDQMALYPLKTSVVTGKALPKKSKKPTDFVFGNRLIRVGGEKEKAKFQKSPAKFLALLNQAVITEQGKGNLFSRCPVSDEPYGGIMGKPIDLVVAGRLVRVCCKDCTIEVEKAPAEFIAMVDAARKERAKKGHDHDAKKGHDHKKMTGK
tara:strand:- start:31563 stop:32318 length:756 start_codon:yes stop_codon:yes gene_type:complete